MTTALQLIASNVANIYHGLFLPHPSSGNAVRILLCIIERLMMTLSSGKFEKEIEINLKSQRPSLPVIHCNNSAQTFAAIPRLYLLSAFNCFEYRPYINAHWTCQPHFFADRPIMKFDTCHDFISVFAVVAAGQSIALPAAACSGCQYC